MQNDRTDLDRFDQAILRILAVEGRISATELARRIGLRGLFGCKGRAADACPVDGA